MLKQDQICWQSFSDRDRCQEDGLGNAERWKPSGVLTGLAGEYDPANQAFPVQLRRHSPNFRVSAREHDQQVSGRVGREGPSVGTAHDLSQHLVVGWSERVRLGHD